MGIKEWYNSRLNQRVEKTQPRLTLPRLDLQSPKGSKVISTPAQWRTAGHQLQESWPQTNAGPAAGVAPFGKPALINGDIDPKRIDSIDAHETMHQMFDSVSQKFGEKGRRKLINHLLGHTDKVVQDQIGDALKEIGYDPKSPKFGEEVLNYFHTYQTDPLNRERIRAKVKSGWRQELMDRRIKQSWKQVLDAATKVSEGDVRSGFQTMHKALHEADTNWLKQNHDFNYAKVVDHQIHTMNSKPPKAFSNLLASPEKIRALPGSHSEGESAKMVHDVLPFHNSSDPETMTPSGIVMAKPYHKRSEWGTFLYGKLPISGWSTMTTKGLYDASGIGHLCEDVSAVEHEGIPMTVHNFAADKYKPSKPQSLDWYGIKNVDPLALKQIGVMDWLSNNCDRHGGNLLSTVPDDMDRSQPLAIDHERSFQYANTPMGIRRERLDDQRDQPNHYVALRAIGHVLDPSSERSLAANPALTSWWNKNSPAIREEMNRNLVAIKDDRIRSHVRDNFEQRFQAMDGWAKNPDPNKKDFFHPDSGVAVNNREIQPKYPEKVGEILNRLPQGQPYKSAHMLADMAIEKQGADVHQGEVIQETIDKLADKMKPDELAQFFLNHYAHPYLDINEMAQKKFFGPNVDINTRKERLKALVDKLDKMPDNVNKLFPFLRERAQLVVNSNADKPTIPD